LAHAIRVNRIPSTLNVHSMWNLPSTTYGAANSAPQVVGVVPGQTHVMPTSFVNKVYQGQTYNVPGPEKRHRGHYLPLPVKVRRKSHGQTHYLLALFSLLVPTLIFFIVMATSALSIHYTSTFVVYMVDLFAVLAVCALGTLWYINFVNDKDSSWFALACLMSGVAVAVAIPLGGLVYKNSTRPYLDTVALNVYTNVDPTTTGGNEMMDAGQVTFVPFATVDDEHSMGFVNFITYCVAPITIPYASSEDTTYDFWAVGTDCCSGGQSADFACGSVSNPSAHSGLRLLDDSKRNYYRLAVEQATVSYGFRTVHPVFFEWVDDPATTLNIVHSRAHKRLMQSVAVFFFVNLLLVIYTHYAFKARSFW